MHFQPKTHFLAERKNGRFSVIPARTNLAKNWHFWSLCAKDLPFWSILKLFPTKETVRTRCLGGFLICGYRNFCSLPKELGRLAQKQPFLSQNMLSCRLIWCPVCWLVGGCGSRAVSCRTPIYFIIVTNNIKRKIMKST